MIRRPAGYLGIDPVEPKLGQIEFVDKDVDHPNRIILANPVFQAFRKQRVLTAIRPLNEAPHLIPRKIAQESYRQNQIQPRVFTQPVGCVKNAVERLKRSVPSIAERPDEQL
jgi:Flp pilus assembly protein CpaB